ncbi:hypothetical protein EDD18DRAFT_1330233 [Armillaria luteobubalina]|uniref:Uncharacterized protein n=1 Tax=Armillaria luteobubalina TaxID=153913 RepID=A0AA39QC58_9AGAR|nr:hypothetical protein EDD18DRAFT_1330233 [Armillaria luteobubalina]
MNSWCSSARCGDLAAISGYRPGILIERDQETGTMIFTRLFSDKFSIWILLKTDTTLSSVQMIQNLAELAPPDSEVIFDKTRPKNSALLAPTYGSALYPGIRYTTTIAKIKTKSTISSGSVVDRLGYIRRRWMGGNHLAPDFLSRCNRTHSTKNLPRETGLNHENQVPTCIVKSEAMRHTQQIIEIIDGWSTYSLRRVTRGRGCLAHQSVASLSPRRINGAHPMRGLFPSQKVP